MIHRPYFDHFMGTGQEFIIDVVPDQFTLPYGEEVACFDETFLYEGKILDM
jgi:hypothetical protein